ncbi:MAG: hypothetical protein QM501_07765 [Gimesia sp.]
MEWLAFLIYFLLSVCGAFVVWTVIRVGFRVAPPEDSVSPEVPEQESAGTNTVKGSQNLYWNFTATLIVVPALLLVLGITVKTAPLNHPVTGTLAGALLLMWGMALWSGMLAFPDQISEANQEEPPHQPDSLATEFTIPKTKTDLKEQP